MAFLGPPGTFTEEALLSQPDLAAGELVPVRMIPDVILAVDQGEAEMGVVPIENAIEGSVTATLDTLAFERRRTVSSSGRSCSPIDLHLCAPPGTRLADVTTVVSIPHATAQCRDWLARKLPGVEVQAANSTAEAARTSPRPRASAGMASIGTRHGGGQALRPRHPRHRHRGPPRQRDPVRGHRLRGSRPDRPRQDDHRRVPDARTGPGRCSAILQEFAARAINLTKLESRPTKRGLGDYCFFIDCEGHIDDELVADVLRNLAAKHTVQFLGSYPAAGSESATRRRAAGKAWRSASNWVDDLRSKVRPE